jgi:hypothetical protein
MKALTNLISFCAVIAVITLSGCATAPSASTQASTPSTGAIVAPPSSSSSVQSAEVPSLKTVMACGSCSVPDTVPGLIAKGYADAAAKAGVKIASDSGATLTITSYTQRPPAARVMLGIFAGKDEIKATVTYKNKTFEVEDYYLNAWLGMNALSERIGEMAFEKMRK